MTQIFSTPLSPRNTNPSPTEHEARPQVPTSFTLIVLAGPEGLIPLLLIGQTRRDITQKQDDTAQHLQGFVLNFLGSAFFESLLKAPPEPRFAHEHHRFEASPPPKAEPAAQESEEAPPTPPSAGISPDQAQILCRKYDLSFDQLTLADINSKFRKTSFKMHPDRGGSTEAYQQMNADFEKLRLYIEQQAAQRAAGH